MPEKRRSKRVHRLNKGPNDVDQILQIDGILFLLEKEIDSIRANTDRSELRSLRNKIMKLCNPDRQGIAQTQRDKAGELRDEFHRKLSQFNIPRWWQYEGRKSSNSR